MKTLIIVVCFMIVAAAYADMKSDIEKFNKDKEECTKLSKADDIVGIGSCMLEKQKLVTNGKVYKKEILDRMESVITNKPKAEEAKKLINQCWAGESEVAMSDKDKIASIILCSFSVTKYVEEM